jgi:hypothetical protein
MCAPVRLGLEENSTNLFSEETKQDTFPLINQATGKVRLGASRPQTPARIYINPGFRLAHGSGKGRQESHLPSYAPATRRLAGRRRAATWWG